MENQCYLNPLDSVVMKNQLVFFLQVHKQFVVVAPMPLLLFYCGALGVD